MRASCIRRSAGVTLSQARSISVQRYIDLAGNVPVRAAISAALSANTPGAATVTNDGIAFQSFRITISNSSSSAAANVSNFGIVLSA
jgi:hypothetical protein